MLDSAKRAEFFQKNMGGQAFWEMLRRNGYGNEEIRELVDFHLADRRMVTEFMGGAEVLKAIDPSWREPLFVVSTLRYLCETLDAWNPRRQYAEDAPGCGRGRRDDAMTPAEQQRAEAS